MLPRTCQAVVGGLISNFGVVQYAIGMRHPFLLLYCNDADAEGWAYDATTGDWLNAKVTLTFGPLPYPESSDDQIEIDYDITSEELVLPKSQLTINGEPLEDSDVKPIKIINTGKIVLKAPFQAQLDPSLWAPYCGKVNSTTFRGWGPGKVLFQNPKTRHTISVNGGADQYEFTYEFLIRMDEGATWNHIFRAGSGWLELDQHLYGEADLNNLF